MANNLSKIKDKYRAIGYCLEEYNGVYYVGVRDKGYLFVINKLDEEKALEYLDNGLYNILLTPRVKRIVKNTFGKPFIDPQIKMNL